MDKQTRRLSDGTWVMAGAEVFREEMGTHSEMTYTGRRKETVAQWAALRPIFEVCAGKTGYTGGGSRKYAWWIQGVTDKQFLETLEEISQETRIWRQG